MDGPGPVLTRSTNRNGSLMRSTPTPLQRTGEFRGWKVNQRLLSAVLFLSDLVSVFSPQVELYRHHTRPSAHGRPLLLCDRKHHGGVWWIAGSKADVWIYVFKTFTTYDYLPLYSHCAKSYKSYWPHKMLASSLQFNCKTLSRLLTAL